MNLILYPSRFREYYLVDQGETWFIKKPVRQGRVQNYPCLIMNPNSNRMNRTEVIPARSLEHFIDILKARTGELIISVFRETKDGLECIDEEETQMRRAA
jgi:hypothetical protein